MGLLKRLLKQAQEGEDAYLAEEDDHSTHRELSDDTSTSEEEEEEEEEEENEEEDDAVEAEEEKDEDVADPSDNARDRVGSDGLERMRKNKVMILASRGINARQRHLMDDLVSLMPHAKKESKFDTKRELFALNELAELNGCNHVLFFETRKPQELFLWAAKSPSGPSVRFHVQNIHTLEELHLTGNCMRGGRPVLTFDPIFGKSAHGQVMKSLLEGVFGTPKDHRKTRPYIDRVMHFGWSDDRVWVRNYQITEGAVGEESVEGLALTEIGPRFILHPVRVLEASFSGRTLWQNPHYVPASVIRSSIRMQLAARSKQRNIDQETSYRRKKEAVLPDNELDHIFD